MPNNQEEKILEELKSLKETVRQLRERLEVLERQQVVQPPEIIQPSEEAPYSLSEIEKPVLEEKPVDIEKIVGEWLPRIGMLALFFGVGFFLKYAFDHKWIGPVARVILGLLSGLSLLGAGEYFEKKKYHNYARVLTGGGLSLLYLSLYAARNFYQMIEAIPTFIAMIFVTLAAGFFAIRHNSQIIGLGSIIGGFLTPFLIGALGTDRIGILCYMGILNLGILGLAFSKNWRTLNLAAFVFTTIIYLNTYGQFHASETLFISLGFLTFYFLIFAFVTLLNNIIYRLPTFKEDIYFILGNAFYYYCFSYFLLKPNYTDLLGLFTFGMAIFYLILTYLAFLCNSEEKLLPLVLLGIAITFATLGIAIQFDQYWITIFWTLEALLLLWFGFQIRNFLNRNYNIRVLGLAILVLALLRLILIDSQLALDGFIPIFNERVFVFLFYIGSLFLVAELYSFHKEKLDESERRVSTISVLAANVLIIYLMSVEIIDYFGLKMKELSSGKPDYLSSRRVSENKKALLYQRDACLSIAWSLYAIILIAIGIIKKYKPIRLMALMLFGITTFKVFLVDLSFLRGFPRILSFMILGLILLGAGFLYNKYKDKISEFV